MTRAGTISPAVTPVTHQISVKGRMQSASALRVGEHIVVVSGRLLRVAEVFDAYWVQADTIPDPDRFIEQLQACDAPPDLFLYTERVPQNAPRFDFHVDWENVAAIPISTHEHWLQKQISSASRRNVKTGEKKGITVRVCDFDEAYVRGIMSISDESPVRAGRQYWHYGKPFDRVQAEQGTYRERSTFLGAFLGDEMVGYLKLVWDTRTAAIMQIVSLMKHRDKRTNNAMLSAAVRLCAERGVEYLLYERFVYGNKTDSSLTRFKRENGFIRFDVPQYVVPLTAKGRAALRLGLHKNIKDRLPQWIVQGLIDARDKWHARRAPANPAPDA